MARATLPLCLGLAGLALLVPQRGLARTTKRSKKPKKPVILHVGDSFTAAGLAQALKPRFEKLGFRYVSKAQTSGYTTTLKRQLGLPYLFKRHKPALVIYTLGANEMKMPEPEDHAHAVRYLSKDASKLAPCVWTLPPRWSKKGGGILNVIRRDAKPCAVFDINAVIQKPIQRQRDGIHPSKKGGARWAKEFWTWMFKVEKPNPRRKKSKKPKPPWAARYLKALPTPPTNTSW